MSTIPNRSAYPWVIYQQDAQAKLTVAECDEGLSRREWMQGMLYNVLVLGYVIRNGITGFLARRDEVCALAATADQLADVYFDFAAGQALVHEPEPEDPPGPNVPADYPPQVDF